MIEVITEDVTVLCDTTAEAATLIVAIEPLVPHAVDSDEKQLTKVELSYVTYL